MKILLKAKAQRGENAIFFNENQEDREKRL
jgi:hypothetical protein